MSDTAKPWYQVSYHEFSAASDVVPDPEWMSGELPAWVQHLFRDLVRTYTPAARLDAHLKITPRSLGGMLGHQVAGLKAYAASLTKETAALSVFKAMLLPNPETLPDFPQVLAAWSEELAEPLHRTFMRAVSAPVEQGAEFFEAFARALKSPVRAGERTNTAVCLLLASCWQRVESFATIPELHQWLCGLLTPGIVGNLKRLEKMCQRIGLKLHKRGRPKSPPSKRKVRQRPL